MKKVLIIYIILVMGISLIADTPITSFKAMIWNQFINDLMEIKIDVAYDEAENRLHAQKAIMTLLMGGRL